MSYEYVAAEPSLSFQCNNLLKIFSDYSLFSLSNAVNLASTISKGRPTVFHFSSFCESLSKSSSLGTSCLTTKIKTSQRRVKMKG